MRKCANPARILAPDAAVSAALRLPPCRFRQRSGRQLRSSGILGGSSVSTASFPSNTGAKRSSTTTATRKSGRACLRISSAGVVRTQSPSERRRMTATRARFGRRSNTGATVRFPPLLFDLRLVDQHDWNVVPDRVDPMALDALQPLLVFL